MSARALSARACDLNRNARLPRLNERWRKRLVVRVILQEINGEKRPEKARDFFGVSNLTLFIFMFPIAHDNGL